MPWILFAIISAALYAASSLFDKFLIEKKIKDPILLTILGGMIFFIFGLIVIFFRGFEIFQPWAIFLLLLSGISTEIALVPYYKALSLEDASRISPLFQIIPIFVLLLSYIFLGEFLTRNQLLGFVLILAGSFIISVKKTGGVFRIRKAFLWVLLSSFLWSIPLVLFKLVAIKENFWSTLTYEAVGVAIGSLILFVYYRNKFSAEFKKIEPKTWLISCLNEIIYFIGRLCNFYALFLGSVSLVSVLNGFNPLFVLFFGFILSKWFPQIVKENTDKKTIFLKLSAIILMFAGLWLINI